MLLNVVNLSLSSCERQVRFGGCDRARAIEHRPRRVRFHWLGRVALAAAEAGGVVSESLWSTSQAVLGGGFFVATPV